MNDSNPTAETQLAEAQALLSRIARCAVRYDARVYALTDDFAALCLYLSGDDIVAATERPSETESRVEAERDALAAQLAQVREDTRSVAARIEQWARADDAQPTSTLLAKWTQDLRAAVSGEPLLGKHGPSPAPLLAVDRTEPGAN